MRFNKLKIEKKDLFYWILILVLTIITILTIRLGNNADVVGYLGFGGTIASILLAVVALIYSFVQTAASGNTTAILEDSAKKIENVTASLVKVDEITEVANKLEGNLLVLNTISNSINSANINMENSLREISSTVQQQKKLYEASIATNKNQHSIKESLVTTSNADGDIKIKIELTKDMEFGYLEYSFLYSLMKAEEEKRSFNLEKFTIFYLDKNRKLNRGISDENYDLEMKNSFSTRILGYFDGMYRFYERFKLIDASGAYNEIHVEKINSELKELIIFNIQDAIKSELNLPNNEEILN